LSALLSKACSCLEEDWRAAEVGGVDRFADLALVAVGGGVDVSIAGAQRIGDGEASPP
jgi:hypothetical protein